MEAMNEASFETKGFCDVAWARVVLCFLIGSMREAQTSTSTQNCKSRSTLMSLLRLYD